MSISSTEIRSIDTIEITNTWKGTQELYINGAGLSVEKVETLAKKIFELNECLFTNTFTEAKERKPLYESASIYL